MNLSTNSKARTHITFETSLVRPVKSLSTTYETIPNTIPSAMLYANGIMTIVKNAGIASVKSMKLIFVIGVIMNSPTITSAGAVAAAGIIVNKGAKKSAMANIPAVARDVSPVLPPSATPAALSTYVVTVLVPRHAPTIVPTASAISAFPTLGSLPFSSSIPALEDTPASVPTVSNISTKRNVNTTTSISSENISSNPTNLKATSATDGGRLTMLNPSGIIVTPNGIPINVV